MNALAGFSSIFAALYLAARFKGLGAPLEEQPIPESALEAPATQHLQDARTFARAASSAVLNARDAVIRRDCRKTHTLLQAADAALVNMAAHAHHLPARSSDRSGFHQLHRTLKVEFDSICALHDSSCTTKS